MSESVIQNLQAFTPYAGGAGARISVTGTTGSAPIPGLEGGMTDPRSRVVVSNSGSSSAYVRFGKSGVVATNASYEILAGTKEVLTPPFVGPAPMYVAAICAGSTTTTINVCAGIGT